jgi:hypothetical protein
MAESIKFAASDTRAVSHTVINPPYGYQNSHHNILLTSDEDHPDLR